LAKLHYEVRYIQVTPLRHSSVIERFYCYVIFAIKDGYEGHVKHSRVIGKFIVPLLVKILPYLLLKSTIFFIKHAHFKALVSITVFSIYKKLVLLYEHQGTNYYSQSRCFEQQLCNLYFGQLQRTSGFCSTGLASY
jgi:hypothetical protein